MSDYLKTCSFDRIITPSVEYFDQIEHALGHDLKQHCIMFMDHYGHRLVLRPDHTAAIARIVSSRLVNELPVKLYYYDPIFRRVDSFGDSEMFQFGCEHIGRIDISDEANMINYAIECCRQIGINDVEIYASHSDLFKSQSYDYTQALKQGDFSTFKEMPKKQLLSDARDFDYFSQLSAQIGANDNVFVHYGLYKDPTYYNGVYFDIVCLPTERYWVQGAVMIMY